MNATHTKIWEALKEVDYKDVLTRSLWTFVQTFAATFLIAGESIVDLLFQADWSALVTLLLATALAALAAALSAVKTIIVETIRTVKKNSEK